MWNFVFNYNNDLHHQKVYKDLHIRPLNSFFISKIVFELYAVKNAFLSLLRHFGPIFTFKIAITQRLSSAYGSGFKFLSLIYGFLYVFRRRKVDNWGGGGRYSYIHVLHHLFPLKAIVFTVCEHEYMNICPPPPITDFPASLDASHFYCN